MMLDSKQNRHVRRPPTLGLLFWLLFWLQPAGSGSLQAANPRAPSTAAREAILEKVGVVLTHEAFALNVDFDQWPYILAKHRDAIEAAPTQAAFIQAVNRALDEFGVSHVKIKTKRAERRKRQGNKHGLGIYPMPIEDGLLVTWITPNSPAARLGLSGGDVITNIDGRPAASPIQLRKIDESPYRLLWHNNDGVQKGTIRNGLYNKERPGPIRILNQNIHFLRIPSFDSGTYDEAVVEALFRNAGQAEGVILDLRSNPGGEISNLKHLLSFLIPHGKPLFHEIREGRRQGEEHPIVNIHRAKRKSSFYQGPLVVLIDYWTASSGEIFAATIKEYGRGHLIGTTTQGLVLPSMIFDLPHGFRLQIPVADLTTPAGRRLEQNPTHPHAGFPAVQTAQEEIMILAALRYLETEHENEGERPLIGSRQ